MLSLAPAIAPPYLSFSFSLSFSIPACLKAAKGLYHLTDVDHKSNRTVVASHSPEILGILCNCVQNVLLPDIRHLGLLICNNLSIPLESKLILNQSTHAREIYNTCLNVIDTDPREAYLGSICLMNLSFLASAVPAMLVAGSGDNDHKAKVSWIGLDWIELDWIGLSWIGLSWIGLDWIGLD